MMKLEKSTQKMMTISEKLLAYLKVELKNSMIDYASTLKKLEGGFETEIYRFKLSGAGKGLSQYLVLRLYPEFYGVQNALWESTIQNVLASVGYPTAEVHFVCKDMSILGGAFFIMDYLPGKLLMSASAEIVPTILGGTHAELHQLNPEPLVKALKMQGIDEHGYSLDARLNWLQSKTKLHPWLLDGYQWLCENRPPEPTQLSVCHGDFHPLNILVKDGAVTGVLDWGGFSIADPVFDIANTFVIITIPAKYLVQPPMDLPAVDWDGFAARYLSEYQKYKTMDKTNLDYYIVRRCFLALLQGVEGQVVWQHSLVRRDVMDQIYEKAGVRIDLPEV